MPFAINPTCMCQNTSIFKIVNNCPVQRKEKFLHLYILTYFITGNFFV